MVGIRHRCIPVPKRSDEAKAREIDALRGSREATGPHSINQAGVGSERTSLGASGGRRGKTRIPKEGATVLKSVSNPAPPDSIPAFRKPLAKDAHKTLMATRPWEAAGISRRTWYRRQKESKQ